jgi:hypothetical protein
MVGQPTFLNLWAYTMLAIVLIHGAMALKVMLAFGFDKHCFW